MAPERHCCDAKRLSPCRPGAKSPSIPKRPKCTAEAEEVGRKAEAEAEEADEAEAKAKEGQCEAEAEEAEAQKGERSEAYYNRITFLPSWGQEVMWLL